MKILIIAQLLSLWGVVIFRDIKTNEPLVGVKMVNTTGINYSNFDGGGYISDSTKVSYISYKDTIITSIDSSQVIYLTPVE